MKMKNLSLIVITIVVTICGCKKQDEFLNKKPNQSFSTITTIADINNLLNNQQYFNENLAPCWGQDFSDDQYLPAGGEQNLYATFSIPEYKFAKDIFTINDTDYGWNFSYQTVYIANTVLDALPNIKGTSDELNKAKGTALFCRAYAFYDLVQTYAMPYDSLISKNELGIPLRTTSDLNVKSVRANEQDCYAQIISDLKTALSLLPTNSQTVTLPSKLSVNALLARIYFEMGSYNQAYNFANSALSINGNLTDFNKLNIQDYYISSPDQFPFNEVIYLKSLASLELDGFASVVADSTLYASYENNDIRKNAFFTTYYDVLPHFRGSYDFKRGSIFCGLATDEMYLIRAESSVRMGNISQGMADLNKLLVNRYRTGTFVGRTAASATDALNQIMLERRKELYSRGIRWLDLRRLNKDPNTAVTLVHVLAGVRYTLPPNDPRYAMQIPPIEIQFSGIQQNPR